MKRAQMMLLLMMINRRGSNINSESFATDGGELTRFVGLMFDDRQLLIVGAGVACRLQTKLRHPLTFIESIYKNITLTIDN